MPNAPKPKIVTRKHLARLEREKRQRRYILIGTAIVILIVVGSIVYGLLDANVFQYNQAVASVGSQVITVRDFQNAVRFQRSQLIQQYDQYLQFYQQFQGDPFGIGPQLDSLASSITNSTALGSSTVDRLVQDIVIANEAAKRGIVVSDADIQTAYETVFGYFPNGTSTPTTTPTEYLTPTLDATQLAIITITPTPTEAPTSTSTPTETPTVVSPTATIGGATPTAEPPTGTPTITPTATPYTLQGFQTVAANYLKNLKPINVDETYIRKLLRAQLLREKLTEAISNEVATSQDQVWARHILVADQATATTIETRLKNGEDFGTLAKELSTDTATKANGGDLGWFENGVMDPAFETAAFALKVGEISQPVQTSAGWHVIQSLGHEVRPLTADQLSTARSTAFTTWLNTQTSEKDVVKYENVWSQKVPTDPVFTPVVIPTQAPQAPLPTSSTLEPTSATTPQPAPLDTPQPTAAQPTATP